MICKHCQKEMPLRAFRLPPNRCVQCGQFQDPDRARSDLGCLLLTPVAILSALVCGYIAGMLGRMLVPILRIPDIEALLATLAAIDAVAIVCFVHVKRYRTVAEHHDISITAISLGYLLIGFKCAQGRGTNLGILVSLINAICGTLITRAVLRYVRSSPQKEE